MSEVPLDQLSARQFDEHVRTTFQVMAGPGVVLNLELFAVTGPPSGGQGSRSPGGATFESFALLFEGPADQSLSQQTYRFSHERLGSFDLFIVPVSAERNARQYEAIFNRRLAPGTSDSTA